MEVDSLDITVSGTLTKWTAFITEVIRTIAEFNKDSNKIDFFYDGIKSISFQDEINKSQVIDIMNLMESSHLANTLNDFEEDLTIVIGNENEIDIIKENSIIVSSFYDRKKRNNR